MKKEFNLVFYGLYSDKQDCLMFYSFRNDYNVGLSSEDSEFELLYVTTDKKMAEFIVNNPSSPDHFSSYEHPNWNEEFYGKLRVVQLNKEI